jgi:hypothetical protein
MCTPVHFLSDWHAQLALFDIPILNVWRMQRGITRPFFLKRDLRHTVYHAPLHAGRQSGTAHTPADSTCQAVAKREVQSVSSSTLVDMN